MNVDVKLNQLRNAFYSELSKIQDANSVTFYGFPPGWDSVNRKKIEGKPANISMIEKMCKLKGF